MGWGDENDDTPRRLYGFLHAGDAEGFSNLIRERPEFLRRPDGSEAWLIEAAQLGVLPVVELLVQMGLDVNEARNSNVPTMVPLWIAAAEGHLNVVAWLLDHGAQINIEFEGQQSCFPLFNAARQGHLDIVKLLIERGANTDFIWNGRNVVMEASTYRKKVVVEYLKSMGIPDLRDITPPDFPGSHDRIIKIVTSRRGQLRDWSHEIDGDPALKIHAAGPGDKWDAVTFFTTGLSDIILKLPNGRPVATELSLSLPTDWPLDEQSLEDPQWNWPIVWMDRIARQTRQSETWPDRFEALFMNGEPPTPLAAGTDLCGWVCLQSQRGNHQMPDYRYIDIYGMFPIYLEERALIANEGGQALVQRFQAHSIPQYIVPDRPNVADDKYVLPDDFEFEEGCDL